MKKIYVLWGFALITVMANVFFACKSDDTIEGFYRKQGLTLNPALTPDFVIYSNGNVLSSTLGTRSEFGTRADGTPAYANSWDWGNGEFAQYSTNPPAEITNASEILSAITTASETTSDATNYFVQWVGCGNNSLGLTNIAFNGLTLNNTNQYYWNIALIINTPLTNVTCEKNGATVSKYKLYDINGGLYLGIDGNDDDNYSDWVFKITPVTAASDDNTGDNGNENQGGDENQGGNGNQGGTEVQVNGNYYKVVDYENATDNAIPEAYKPYKDKAPAQTDRGESVSQAEYDYVMWYLAEHPNEGGLTCDLTTYFIQNVGSSKFEYKYAQFPTLKDKNGATYNVIGGDHMDYVGFSNHRNDYNAVSGPRALLINVPIEDPTYHETWGDVDKDKHNAYRFYVIEYEGQKNLYLCYDYQTKKNSGEYLDGDKVFNDWVIKIIPAEGEVADIEELVTDIVPVDEVEVNLSVNDKKEEGDYIATKLSIHIRALTDVEVFIPVEQVYYCDVDDMAIVLSHNLNVEEYYPGQDRTANSYTYNYTVAGNYVKDGGNQTVNATIYVTVTYGADGIRVKTQGMTQDILDYLQYNYQDGITIEVWNYFNSEIPTDDGLGTKPFTREELKPMLDNSTVTFTSAEHPAYYVNAFAMLYDYQKVDLHVYMKDNKPYLMDVTYDADGHIINQVESNTPLASKYWVANEDGTFKEFVGEKNAWDSTVSPSDAWTKTQVNTGKSPANFNEIYTK